MKSGATESSFYYLSQHYEFPEDVEVSHLPEELKKSSKPYKVLWAHHAYDQPAFVNFNHEEVTHIVTPSHWAKEQLIKFHKVPKNKITVISNGVSDIFTYSENKTKTFIHTSIPYKGLELMPAIIKRIQQKHPDAKFKIFSSMSLYGPLNDPYLELYEDLKKLPNVEYSQAVDQEELVAHYQDAAFFIHPNIWEETFCVAMTEAMKSGCYPIITNIGALQEVAGENFASVVPLDGTRTTKGYEVTEKFLNTFAEVCCTALDYFDGDRTYYNQISKSLSNHISQKCDWKKIAQQWKKLITRITSGEPMTNENTALSYTPVTSEQAVMDEEYLRKAFENVLKWEESDKELAQGRTNFQLEKFALLDTHTLPVAFENTLKSRRQMAEGYMYKLIEMKEKVREFEYKWKDQDRSQPIFWEESGPGGGSKKLCWFDLDELALTHYLKSCELEIRDRLHQMEHLDKILAKLVEENGGKPVSREQFLEGDALYWERRFADQAMDEMIASQTGISIGNLHSMRRASAPAIVDKRNELPEGYLPLNRMLESPQGKMEFLNDLQKKVLTGIQEVTGENLGMITGSTEEQKKLEGN
jgi:glycosyltransferase involved in cell wall biosynthesis